MSPLETPGRAASVILLRDAPPEGFEVFLASAPGGSRTHDFPCGPVRRSDHAVAGRCRGLSPAAARRIIGARFAPGVALGFWIAAIRTLFEEVGILLAVDENGASVTPEPGGAARLVEARAALRERSLDFRSFLGNGNFYCDAASLAYFSQWQTSLPSADGADTRFFLAAPSALRTSAVSAGVMPPGLWLTPDRALRLLDRGELALTFPVFASLRTLADFDRMDALLREYPLKRS